MGPKKVIPFYLVICDYDVGKFTVVDPMTDDTRWIDAVAKAQENGRNINCHTPGEGQTKEMIIDDWKKTYGGTHVQAGVILKPPFD